MGRRKVLDDVKGGEMGVAYGWHTWGRREMHAGLWVRKCKGIRVLERPRGK
jgi:hypothetical protein